MNHIELRCMANTIAVDINGTTVASAQDTTYRDGRMWIGASVDHDAPTFGIAMFDNLAVRGIPAPARAPDHPPTPPQLPVNLAREANYPRPGHNSYQIRRRRHGARRSGLPE